MPFIRRPGPCGLYNPDFEKDSCGVGFIANIKGKQSHRVVEDALHILCRMDHRGARGAEENTGDGAGILTALPDSFLRRVAAEESGITLPAPGPCRRTLLRAELRRPGGCGRRRRSRL